MYKHILELSAVDLSKYIVTKCVNDNVPISNLQLQKILYYIQKYFLKQNELAFVDDIEAWQFGPVVPNVYYQFCGFGAMPINNEYDNITINCKNNKGIIDNIIELKRVLNPWQMVEETHKKDGAWDTIYKGGIGNHEVIPIKLIKEKG